MTPTTLILALIGAVDGDTIKHNGQSYRLWGIDAQERGEPVISATLPYQQAAILARAAEIEMDAK